MGALLQLASLGSADAFLTANPDVTFWKGTYKRATPHATEAVEMQASGVLDFGSKASVAVARTGDLLHKVYLEVTLPDLRDFYTAPINASATQPKILRAYRVTASTAAVRIQAPSTGEYNAYVVTGTTSGVSTFAKSDVAGFTDVTLTSTGPEEVTVVAVQAPDVPAFLDLDDAGVTTFLTTATKSSVSPARQILNLKWTNAIGHALVDSVEWEIGGNRIDRIPNAEYLDIWNELTVSESHREGFNAMIGKSDTWTLGSGAYQGTYYVPIPFTFTKNTAGAVPLVALTFHETRLNFIFKGYLDLIKCDAPVSQLVSSTGQPVSLVDCRVYCDVVFLDTFERRRFSQVPHEMLIEQIQYLGDTLLKSTDIGTVRKIPLDGFNHPVKEIFFVYQPYGKYQRDAVDGNDHFVYDTATGADPIADVRLVLNGQERFTARPMQYFYQVQPYQHHTRVPAKKICVYSFAINPENSMSPQGSCNFGRLDHAALHIRVTDGLDPQGGRIKVYGLAWNVLRVAEGMAQVAFAN